MGNNWSELPRSKLRDIKPVHSTAFAKCESKLSRLAHCFARNKSGQGGARVLAALLVCLALCLACSACGKAEPEPSASEEKRVVLGFSQLGDESEWRSASSRSIKSAAVRANVQLIFENAQQKQENQIKAIRSFIVNQVDVIAFSPIVEGGWENVLLEAKAAGIPVILVDRYIKTEEKGLYAAFIGSDFTEEGRKAGRWLKERFKYRGRDINIVEISGTPDSSPANGRGEGFREELEGTPKFKIVNSASGDFMRSKGKECMENILAETPDFDVLYAHNDDMAMGAIEVLEKNGISPGKDVVIISVDAQKSGLEALKLKKVNCLIECSPYVGDALMGLVARAAAGEPLGGDIYTEERVFTDRDDPATLPELPSG